MSIGASVSCGGIHRAPQAQGPRAALERLRGENTKNTTGRSFSDQRPGEVVRGCGGGTEGSGRLPAPLQPRTDPPGPGHGRQNALSGVP